jgi:GR25 family glycosyltransferase involved in LPS biosynthesis
MNINFNYKYIILLSVLIIILLYFFYNYNKYFTNSTDKKINAYVIHLKRSPERIKNINLQQTKTNIKINLFDAVDGRNINVQELLDSGFLCEKFSKSFPHKPVYGCYLSHYNLLNKIKQDNDSDYTIIFEDDFNIDVKDFDEQVNYIINNNDFDIVFLGNLNNNKGIHVKDNLYRYDKNTPLWGTHGYLVNNKKIKNIIDNLQLMNDAIDVKYMNLLKENKIDGLVCNPILVSQLREKYGTTIQGVV